MRSLFPKYRERYYEPRRCRSHRTTENDEYPSRTEDNILLRAARRRSRPFFAGGLKLLTAVTAPDFQPAQKTVRSSPQSLGCDHELDKRTYESCSQIDRNLQNGNFRRDNSATLADHFTSA